MVDVVPKVCLRDSVLNSKSVRCAKVGVPARDDVEGSRSMHTVSKEEPEKLMRSQTRPSVLGFFTV